MQEVEIHAEKFALQKAHVCTRKKGIKRHLYMARIRSPWPSLLINRQQWKMNAWPSSHNTSLTLYLCGLNLGLKIQISIFQQHKSNYFQLVIAQTTVCRPCHFFIEGLF